MELLDKLHPVGMSNGREFAADDLTNSSRNARLKGSELGREEGSRRKKEEEEIGGGEVDDRRCVLHQRRTFFFRDVLRFLLLWTTVCELIFVRFGQAVQYLGYEAEWRDTEDHEKRTIFILDPTQTAAFDGILVGWHVYTTRGRRSQVVHLQIWRPVEDDRREERRRQKEEGQEGDSRNEGRKLLYHYSRVGETVIAALWVGHNFFPLYPADRIRIRSGDVIGIFFPGYNPIPWSAVPCDHGNELLFRHVTSAFESAAEMTFEKRQDGHRCRRYSLNATVMDYYEEKQYDSEYEDTTDGRYERRPYGRHLPRRRYNSSSKTLSANSVAMLCMLLTLINKRLFQNLRYCI